jgi:hypothetical protein
VTSSGRPNEGAALLVAGVRCSTGSLGGLKVGIQQWWPSVGAGVVEETMRTTTSVPLGRRGDRAAPAFFFYESVSNL